MSRGTGFNIKYFVLIIAAMVMLVFWAFQRLYTGTPSNWLIVAAVVLALWGFGWAIWDIVMVWKRNRSRNENMEN
ncbi:MAG TPA: hypothetical protein P5200_00470 [Tenuifilaceae bacterium]|nr:hypothetical protein [Tenuifilaceae bacterium]